MNKLHVYGQYYPHQLVYIVGNREALEELSHAIQRALAIPPAVTTEAFTNDGEAYDVVVLQVDDAEFGQLRLPYTAEELSGLGGPDTPYDVLKRKGVKLW